jgi:hypothetical protein
LQGNGHNGFGDGGCGCWFGHGKGLPVWM